MSLFGDRDYRHLFGAQAVSLGGNGLATVGLALLAFQLAGPRAGAVLGTALTIKMALYVVVAPVAGAYVGRIERRLLLVLLDVVRALVVLALPFVSAVWQIYVLVAVLQCASAAFTPTYQAVLPDVVPNERDYLRALSYSQSAATAETLLSPLLAAVLISVASFHWLFAGTAVGFVLSAILVLTSRIPDRAAVSGRRAFGPVLAGVRRFAATPRLRGLMGLNLAVASIGAIVMVDTVTLVQQHLGRPGADVAWLLTANGAGVLVAALLAPVIVGRIGERALMLAGASVLTVVGVALVAGSATVGGAWQWPALLGCWVIIGAGTGAVLTPVGHVLRRCGEVGDRPGLFAAQFSLSHACWALTYPIAGWVATGAGYTTAWALLAGLAATGAVVAVRAWRPAVVDPRGEAVPSVAADEVPAAARRR